MRPAPPKGTVWFCTECRRLQVECRCSSPDIILIDKQPIGRDERGRIVDVQAATTKR